MAGHPAEASGLAHSSSVAADQQVSSLAKSFVTILAYIMSPCLHVSVHVAACNETLISKYRCAT